MYELYNILLTKPHSITHNTSHHSISGALNISQFDQEFDVKPMWAKAVKGAKAETT
jgi:hypothetical protein